MKLYLDVCCLNRPFDDQSQDRIHLESEAVLLILSHIETGDWEGVSGDVVDLEVSRSPDTDRRERVSILAGISKERVTLTKGLCDRADELQQLGFDLFDALHLASAEAANADVLLTTDDRFVRIGERNRTRIEVEIINPVTWLERT